MVGLAVAGRPDTPTPEEGAASADSVNFRMAEHRWVHRLLFVFALSRHGERFGVAHSAFRTVLVGKDGAEKRRDAAPVTARSLFDTIDAMPMRQREMREGGGGTP